MIRWSNFNRSNRFYKTLLKLKKSGAGIFGEGRNEEETAEAVLGRNRNRCPQRCPTSRTAGRQRVLSHPLAPIASHRPTLLRPHRRSNHRIWYGISFPTRWSHGHASARSRDRAHQAPATSLQPSSGCCFESHQRLAGSHGAQRGFFVAVAKDSPEVTLVIESVLR